MRCAILASLLALSACGAPAPEPATPEPATPQPASSSATPAPSAPIFRFDSCFWANVHHALHHAATSRRPPPASAPPMPDDPAWTAAVAYYRARFAERGGMAIFLEPELVAITRRIDALGDEELDPSAPPAGLDAELALHLAAAGAVMREQWPAQDAVDRAWIAALEPLLAEHGDAMRTRLSAIYGVAWPDGPITVHVSCFAGPVGAYTLEDPVETTISSCDPAYAGPASLEMIFHEASHALSGPLEARIEAEAARLGREPPPGLWHAVIFYTAGELARRRLGADYVPYAIRNGLFGGPMGELAPLEQHWLPYVDGERSLVEAVAALVEASAREP